MYSGITNQAALVHLARFFERALTGPNFTGHAEPVQTNPEKKVLWAFQALTEIFLAMSLIWSFQVTYL